MSNREIKFRAIYQPGYGEQKMFDVHSFEFDVTVNGEIPMSCIELMQFTGLKDKNGIEIYEGDLVQSNGLVSEVKIGIFYAYLTQGSYKITGVYTNYDGFDCPVENGTWEVIGNIHENPELLKSD